MHPKPSSSHYAHCIMASWHASPQGKSFPALRGRVAPTLTSLRTSTVRPWNYSLITRMHYYMHTDYVWTMYAMDYICTISTLPVAQQKLNKM